MAPHGRRHRDAVCVTAGLYGIHCLRRANMGVVGSARRIMRTHLTYAAPGGFTSAGWHTYHMPNEATEGHYAVEMRFTAQELKEMCVDLCSSYGWKAHSVSARTDDLVLAVNEASHR